MQLTDAQKMSEGLFKIADPSEILIAEAPFRSKENCVAHVGEPVMIDYRYPICRSGRMQGESLVRLVYRFELIIRAGTNRIRYLLSESDTRREQPQMSS